MDRTRLARLLLVVPLLAAGIALGAPRPAAAATVCNTTINGGTIRDSIVVPAGATCGLSGAVVRGEVTVEPGARFTANQTEIRGSIVATGGFNVVLEQTTVRGSISISGTSSLVVLSTIEVRGNLEVTDNPSLNRFLIFGSSIRGTATILRNNLPNVNPRGLIQNSIDADLVCEGNTSGGPVLAAFPGGGNIVGGVATGQCAGII